MFAGLASLEGAFSLVLNAVQLGVQHEMLLHDGFQSASLEGTLSGAGMTLLILPVPPWSMRR